MSEQEMSSGEALVIIKRLENQHEAFKRLREALETFVTAEKGMPKLTKMRNDLQLEIQTLESRIADTSRRVSDMKIELSDKRAEAFKEHGEFVNKMKKEEKVIKSEHKSSMEAMDEAHKTKTDRLSLEIRELQGRRKEGEKALTVVRNAMKDAKAELDKVA